jgi:mRNA-degrading endonuclease RelE of RelBE toxin-antitoxin system
MVFQETPFFTASIAEYMSDDEYRLLQNELVGNPDKGDLIQGTGGLRKLRFGGMDKGKRGGVRVIYYWRVREDQILMLMAYPKNKQVDLTSTQKKQLKQVVENWNA